MGWPQWGQNGRSAVGVPLPGVAWLLILASRSPALRIPAGSANKPIPGTAITAARTRPTGVTGTVSPYPTVVRVTTLHHIAAGMLESFPAERSFRRSTSKRRRSGVTAAVPRRRQQLAHPLTHHHGNQPVSGEIPGQLHRPGQEAHRREKGQVGSTSGSQEPAGRHGRRRQGCGVDEGDRRTDLSPSLTPSRSGPVVFRSGP